MARLVGATPGPGLHELAARASGNPLYVRELVDALLRERRVRTRSGVADLVAGDGTAPSSLAAAIAERLGFLTDSTAAALRMAALLGMRFTVEHLGLLTARSASGVVDVVREVTVAGVLSDSHGVLMFRHALIRQALYEQMPAALRTALHRQAARALTTAGAPVEDVAEQLLAAPQAR